PKRARPANARFGKTVFILRFYNLRLRVSVENWGLAWGSHLRCALYASFLRLWGQQLTAILPERLSRAVLTWNEQ
ncbi:MAG: hypothetical protein WBE50_05335, partial [Methyloceanibacter sp.]